MLDVVLLLGPIAFRDFEVPSGINFGGRQRLTVHRLPGGARVIDTLGRDDAQISFSGIFSGSDATLRARAVDELRADGLPLELTWDVFFYTVVIADFRADYTNRWWIPFSVTCTVLRDEASALIQSAASLATAGTADIIAAVNQASNAGIDLLSLQTVLTTTGATIRGTAAYTAARSGLVSAQASIDSAIITAGIALSNLNLGDPGSADDGATELLLATSTAGRLSSLTIAGAFVRRIAINLSDAST